MARGRTQPGRFWTTRRQGVNVLRPRRWVRILVGAGTLPVLVTARSAHAGSAGAAPGHPVPAGTYAYATSGRFGYGEVDSYPATTRIRFDFPAGGVQHTHWDQRDVLGNGSIDDQGVSYQRDGVHLVYWDESYADPTGTSTYDCRPTLPQLIVPARPRTGQRFTYTLHCNGYDESFTVTVLAPQTVPVAGQAVGAEVLRADSRWSGGGYSGAGTTYSWMMPGTDLMLKEVDNYDEQYSGVTYYRQYETAQLNSLHPQ